MILEACLLLAPQTFEDDAWFRLHKPPQGATSRYVVSGTRRAAPAAEALQRLARLMRWNLQPPPAAVARRLAPVTVDLAFSRRDPRTVAQLIAAAAGAEATVVRVGRQSELRLTEPSATSTEELRARAVHWYRTVLTDSSVVGVVRVKALAGLGDALVDAGEDRRAIEVWQRVFEQDETGRFTGPALLSAARAYHRLAQRSDRPESQRRSDRHLAEQTARRLLQHDHPTLHASAALLLGQILVTAGRDQDCIELLEGQRARLTDAPRNQDIQLLVAACYARIGQPVRVLAILDSLVAAANGAQTWTREQWRDYHFLRGTSAEISYRTATGRVRDLRLADAMRSLEWHLGAGVDTTRRLQTSLLALGRVYLAKRKYIDARAAVLQLLEGEPLGAEQLQDARILEARTMTALGFGDKARERLALAVRANPKALTRVREYLRDGSDAADSEGRSDRAFHAGRFEEALRELATVASDPDSSHADLFRLARCHEALHLRALGDPATPIEHSARHLEKAYDLFERIERRDVVRAKNGGSTPGPWAIAARGAREMMRWTDDHPKWTPPPMVAPLK